MLDYSEEFLSPESTSISPHLLVLWSIDLSQCRYSIVQQAAVSLGWKIASLHGSTYETESSTDSHPNLPFSDDTFTVIPSPDVIWVDKSILPSRIMNLSPHQRINHFPGSLVIARKVTLFRRLMRWKQHYPFFFSFSPPSFSFRYDSGRLHHFMKTSSVARISSGMRNEPHTPPLWFIMKPNKGCEGKGIYLTTDPFSPNLSHTFAATHGSSTFLSDTAASFEIPSFAAPQPEEDVLVQEYLSHPLCIEGKKCDLRLYVLLTALGSSNESVTKKETNYSISSVHLEKKKGMPLTIFRHMDGIVRMCSEKYEEPHSAMLLTPSSHLTNFAVNKMHTDYRSAEFAQSDDTGRVEETEDCFLKPRLSEPKLSEPTGSCRATSGNKRDMIFLKEYINDHCVVWNPTTSYSSLSVLPDFSITPWEVIEQQINRAILWTILSGVNCMRREMEGSGAFWRLGGKEERCFEIFGFDFLLAEIPYRMGVEDSGKDETSAVSPTGLECVCIRREAIPNRREGDSSATPFVLRPFLMEVNHSSSLFYDTPFDQYVKQRLIRDTLLIVSAELTSSHNRVRKNQRSGGHSSKLENRRKGVVRSVSELNGAECNGLNTPNFSLVNSTSESAKTKTALCASDNSCGFCNGYREVILQQTRFQLLLPTNCAYSVVGSFSTAENELYHQMEKNEPPPYKSNRIKPGVR